MRKNRMGSSKQTQITQLSFFLILEILKYYIFAYSTQTTHKHVVKGSATMIHEKISNMSGVPKSKLAKGTNVEQCCGAARMNMSPEAYRKLMEEEMKEPAHKGRGY